MPRFCTQCGKLLKDDERFCTSCGTPVTGEGQDSRAQEGMQPTNNATAFDEVSGNAATATQPQLADVTVQSAHQPVPAPQPEVGTTQQWATANATAQQPIPTAAPQAGAPRRAQKQQRSVYRYHRRASRRDYRARRVLYGQALR